MWDKSWQHCLHWGCWCLWHSVRHTALWMRKAVENTILLVQGQAELLALTFMGLGFFSSVLPQFHKLNSRVASWVCNWSSSAFWGPALLWSGPRSPWALGAPGGDTGWGCLPLSHHVPQPSSNCRAVCVTGGMQGLPWAGLPMTCTFKYAPLFLALPTSR